MLIRGDNGLQILIFKVQADPVAEIEAMTVYLVYKKSDPYLRPSFLPIFFLRFCESIELLICQFPSPCIRSADFFY